MRKGAPEHGMELNPLFREINRLRNEKKGVVTSRQDPTQPSSNLWKGVEEKFRVAGVGDTLIPVLGRHRLTDL